MFAAQNGEKNVVEILIANGANIDIKDKDGWTASMKAFYQGHVQIVELLLPKWKWIPNTKIYLRLIRINKLILNIWSIMRFSNLNAALSNICGKTSYISLIILVKA